MKTQDFKTTEKPGRPNPEPNLDGAEAAFHRAAQTAYRRAAFYGNKVAIVENGEIVLKTPVPADPASTIPPVHQEYKLV